jgi:hypothetical protein
LRKVVKLFHLCFIIEWLEKKYCLHQSVTVFTSRITICITYI